MLISGCNWSIAATSAVLLTGGCAVLPEPVSDHEFQVTAQKNIAAVSSDQVPVDGPIDLYEAMARALKYNLQRAGGPRHVGAAIGTAGS